MAYKEILNIDASSLKSEILELSKTLEHKKELLFLSRLNNMFDLGIYDTISDIKIDALVDTKQPKLSRWSISYKHHTDAYDSLDYLYDSDKTNDDIGSEEPNENVGNGDIYVDATTLSEHTADSKTNNLVKKSKTEKTTFVTFGKSERYFIKGGTKYNIYNNSKGELRVVNTEYDSELDIEEQCQLISRYSKNKNLPECMALQIFLYMSYNKWDDLSMAIHLSMI